MDFLCPFLSVRHILLELFGSHGLKKRSSTNSEMTVSSYETTEPIFSSVSRIFCGCFGMNSPSISFSCLYHLVHMHFSMKSIALLNREMIFVISTLLISQLNVDTYTANIHTQIQQIPHVIGVNKFFQYVGIT